MKFSVMVCCGLATSCVLGGVLPVPPSKMAEFNARTGGLVYPPSDAKHVLVLDAREKPDSVLSNHIFAAELRMNLACLRKTVTIGPDVDPLKYAREAKTGSAGAVILLCESDGIPALSTFPEEAVSVVNIKPLRSKNEKEYSIRLIREFWRALGFALGGYGSPTTLGTALQPAFSVSDLDAIKGMTLNPPQMGSVTMSRAKLKIYGKRPVPYARACREGWAPAPTNDVQKAIFNKMNNPQSRFASDMGTGAK